MDFAIGFIGGFTISIASYYIQRSYKMAIYSDAFYCSKCQKDISEIESVVISNRNGKSLDYICLQCLAILLMTRKD